MQELFWFILYNSIIVPLMWVSFHLGGFFNRKIRHGIRGRQVIWKSIDQFLAETGKPIHPLLVFHSASLGEYEQIRPILSKIKKTHQNWKLVVTFFSPSGFENFKKTKDIDLAVYLPFDSLRSVNRFFKLLHPNLIVITKHDVWPNFIWAANQWHIPTMLINGTLPLDSKINRFPARNLYRQIYSKITAIHPASETDREQFKKVNATASLREALGDTRFDQVLRRAEESKAGEFFPEEWKSAPFVFIAGSTWPSDEEHVVPAIIDFYRQNDKSRFVVVPHEPTDEHILQLLQYFKKEKLPIKLYSDWKKTHQMDSSPVLLVDQIGILANLYAFSHVAYVGGSFDPGVHNVMEPAASSNVVLFGPRILNSPEAQEFVRRGVGFVVQNKGNVLDKLKEFASDQKKLEILQAAAKSVVVENAGATRRIVRKIEHILAGQIDS